MFLEGSRECVVDQKVRPKDDARPLRSPMQEDRHSLDSHPRIDRSLYLPKKRR